MVAVSCSGIHCAGCGAGAAVPPVALAGLLGLTWVAGHLIEVAVVSAACGVLSVAAVVALMRWQDRRQAAFAARGPLLITRPDAAPLPPARQRELPRVVNIYVTDTEVAGRVARQALPARPVTFTQLPRGNHDQGTA
jgi:hypothetical protein